MKRITLYIGLDVHKNSITIAIAQGGPKGEIRLFGTIANSLQALERTLERIRKAHPGAHLEIAYEAGPCGFVIARRLHKLKVPCLVAAPSLIPKQPGSPFKTDKRDACSIARLLRAGELTAVYVPEPTDEAIRDLCRARTDAVDDLRRCRGQSVPTPPAPPVPSACAGVVSAVRLPSPPPKTSETPRFQHLPPKGSAPIVTPVPYFLRFWQRNRDGLPRREGSPIRCRISKTPQGRNPLWLRQRSSS